MIRGINLRGAVALNVITMIGIGPLVTIPLVLAQLAGPLALAGWIAGALVALCDALVWAELGSRYPGSGGTYVYLREVFGAQRWGRLLAFLFNWQFLLYAPFLLASGYIGFTDYLGYLVPAVAQQWWLHTAASMAVGIVVIVLLYRRITAVAAIGTAFAFAAVGTLLIVIAACLSHGNFHQAFTLSKPFSLDAGFFTGLGSALFITLYDYVGYSDAALLSDEVQKPHRTIPAAILISIAIVGVLYIALQVGILSVVPWQTLVGAHGTQPAQAQFVASTAIASTWGVWAARGVTLLILITAFASLFGNLAGFARIPFAAARDGEFFRVFARLHPQGQFPHVALLVIGIASLAACFFDLSTVIAILTAGIVLIQSVAQIVALCVIRARGEVAPFRMRLFPLPAVIALVGWLLAFWFTGRLAIGAGVGWLVIGIVAYLLTARAQKTWPFVKRAAGTALLIALIGALGVPARAQTQTPFFLYGATFFYERVPRSEWAAALLRYRAMGVNTIDLYVMWNWHELRDGDFDFTGRTNPRRDLVGLLKLIHDDGFKLVLRPGPVIRNEWRNGGYPAWLLERPQYHMPLHDVLEGRYPATATLQNAHSDAAAQEWLNNPVHMRYAARWLRRVLQTVSPWRNDIVAVALDDDQGAYIDNDTWPGPHFHRYIEYLASLVHRSYPGMPVFINTWEMKVTASAPVWAWGNWYQSDAYSIGEHDRTQLEFATGLLQTQHRPIMISEFQAGWLQDADQPVPRPADPANTTLALHTLLQMGAHGIVNFPVQDTLNPAGWEAPWTNAFYSWDAALSVQLTPQTRYAPTAAFGDLVRNYGADLAQTHRAADAAIAYLTSAYDASSISNDQIAQIAQATMDAQRGCRIMRISCSFVDLRYLSLSDVLRYPVLIVPPNPVAAPFITNVRRLLREYRAHGGHVVASARSAHIASPVAGGIPNATLLVSGDHRFGFLDIVNYGRTPLHTAAATVHEGRFHYPIGAQTVPPRDALLVPLGAPIPEAANAARRPSTPRDGRGERIPLRSGSYVTAELPRHSGPAVYRADVYSDGYPAVVFENTAIRLIVSPCAGARAFVFEDRRTGENLFTTIGGLRDAWQQQLPPSSRDYIGKYTHPIATGTFNRCYAVTKDSGARRATFTYEAPDAPPHGVVFRKTVTLDRGAAGFTISIDAAFTNGGSQRAQQLTSLALDRRTQVIRLVNAVGLFEQSKQRLVVVTWPHADVQTAQVDRHDADALLTLTYAPGGSRLTRYYLARAGTLAQAQAQLRLLANRP